MAAGIPSKLCKWMIIRAHAVRSWLAGGEMQLTGCAMLRRRDSTLQGPKSGFVLFRILSPLCLMDGMIQCRWVGLRRSLDLGDIPELHCARHDTNNIEAKLPAEKWPQLDMQVHWRRLEPALCCAVAS